MTGVPGKTGIVYTLDRETGEFLWANPTIHQNVITDIDGPTGKATANDANALQISRSGVAVALVSIPLRYMHSPVEIISRSDIDHAAQLIAQCVAAIGLETDFTP